MKYLLDANIVIWLLGQPERIPAATMQVLLNPASKLFVSTASLLEITGKTATGRLVFDAESRRKTEQIAEWLEVSADHAWRVASLPMIHKDPFDRVLIAQAMIEGMTLVTGDRILGEYGAPVLLV